MKALIVVLLAFGAYKGYQKFTADSQAVVAYQKFATATANRHWQQAGDLAIGDAKIFIQNKIDPPKDKCAQ